jgi:CRISPR system Cascade subunit CasB
MEAAKKEQDFVLLYKRFSDLKERISGLEAELKRAAQPYDLVEIPAFYRLMAGTGTHKGWQRVAYFLPFAKHKEGADSLGKQLAKAGVREMRLFQVIRSEPPNDIIQLRRLLQQVKPTVDWQQFGNMLFYWDYNDWNKRTLLEDYFLNIGDKNSNKGEK